MANEQELLSDEELNKTIGLAKEKAFDPYDCVWDMIRAVAKAQIAKLKDMGWKAPEEVTMFLSLIAEDTLKKARVGYVEWDREKVAIELKAIMVKDRKVKIPWLENTDWDKLDERTQESWLKVADQLKEILTGGE